MGRIARVLENIANRINMNLSGSRYNECEHAQGLGDDSRPLADDDGITIQHGTKGRFTVFGFFDYDNKIASPGEKRIYGRDEDGTVTSHVYLQNDGTMVIANDSYTKTVSPDGSYVETNGNYTKTVAVDGTVNINGLTITPSGNLITASGVSVDDHPHNQGNDSAGNSQVATDAPTPTE